MPSRVSIETTDAFEQYVSEHPDGRHLAYAKDRRHRLIELWRRHYNTVRPHSALGYRPPAPEAIVAGPLSAPLQAVQ